MPKNEVGSAARLASAAGLGLTLALGAVPVVAMAEGVDPIVSGDVTTNLADDTEVSEVSNAADLKKAFSEGGSYLLTGDIALTEGLKVASNTSVSLDLAGHSISSSSNVTLVGSLTVSDSSSEGEGAFSTTSRVLFNLTGPSGSLTVKGGHFSAGNSVASSFASASFTMEGGSLTSAKPVNLTGNNTTISITGGKISASGAFALNAKGTGTSVTIGAANVFNAPVIDGAISLENIPGENIRFLGGYIFDVTNQLPDGATLDCRFGSDITDVLPMNYASERQGDAWVVVELTEENAGVKVQSGEETLYYPSITAMNGSIEAIASGSTITLLKDTSGSLTFSQAGEYVVDLNGYTLTASDNEPCAVRVAASETDVTIKNGGVVLTSLASDASIVSVVGDEDAAPLIDVTLEFDSVNLSAESEFASTGLIVYGLNTNNIVTLKNSSISVPSTVMGVYFPPKGDSTLTVDNTTITAGTGIGIKGGTLTVTGNSHISATGEKVDPTEAMLGGIQETGAAIYLEGNYATDRNAIVEIAGGKFESENSDAVQMMFAPNDGSEEGEETSYKAYIKVSGGSFSSNPVEFLETKHVAKVGDGAYEVMQRENLEPGDYVVAKGDDEIKAGDLQPGLSVSYNEETGEYEVVRPYTPPVVTGDAVMVEQSAGGTVKVSPTRADEGDEVTITATPDEGQEVRGVTVTDADGNEVEVRAGEKDGEYVFEMPGSEVTVTATFGCDGGELCPSNGFADVDPDGWYHDAVDWAVEGGLMSGYGHVAAFGVSDDLSRAQLAKVLWNAAGQPEADPAGAERFSDCSADDWFAEALSWAASEGIISGYDDGTFGPADPVTREQLATMLWRRAGSPEADAELGFADADEVSSFAREAVEWAVSEGVLSGYEDGSNELGPIDFLERCQCALMFMRLAAE